MNIKDLASKIYNFAQSNKQGFTLNINTLKPVTTGIVVSYKDTQNSFSETDLQSVINHAITHDCVVGGWFNSKDKKYYFDSSKVFNSNELNEAIEFGLDNEQEAIFNLDTGKEIWLNEKGSENQTFIPKKFDFSAFADWMLNVVTETVKHYKGDVLIDSYKIISLRNEQLFGSQSIEPQSFSFYWGVRETGTWLYHIGGQNLFTVKDYMKGLGAQKVFFIKFEYDKQGKETIRVHEINKIVMYN